MRRWSADHLLVTTAVQQHIVGRKRAVAKGGGASRLLARNIRNQRGGRAVVGRDTFKGDGLHVGRDIELETQSTWHSEHSSTLRQVQRRNPAKKGCTCESPIRVQRCETTQVGLNGDDWVYASVRVRGLTRFHVALVRCVLSESNGNGGQAMRRAGHARLARALGGSVPE